MCSVAVCDVVTAIREIYAAADAAKVRALIEKHFVPSADEKKRNAEVPTPAALVDEMLAAVPAAFWESPKRVFEPCCGKGNFVLGLFDRFFEGLAAAIPDPAERCRAIAEDCLYFADLTAMNVFVTTEILKCHARAKGGAEGAEYAFKAHAGDTLVMDPLAVWGIEKFDAVVGNPPYNASGRTGTGNTIWQLFTKRALGAWIRPGGYLLFVHPPGWRKPEKKRGKYTGMFGLMATQNQLVYLEIHGVKDGQRVFGCGTRYDWYLVHRVPQYTHSAVLDEHGVRADIDARALTWLPNSNIAKIQSLLVASGGEACPIIYDRSSYGSDKKGRVSATETTEHTHVCVHSTPKAGIRYMYSNVSDRGHFGVPKLIFGDSGIYHTIIDMAGEYGMTEHAMAIRIDSEEEGWDMSMALQSDAFKALIQSCMYSSFGIDWNIFTELKREFWRELE